MSEGLKGKVAIVTGAARGIGRNIAARFAAEGASVIVADVDREQAQLTVAELTATGAAVWTIPVDVAEPAQVKGHIQTKKELHLILWHLHGHFLFRLGRDASPYLR